MREAAVVYPIRMKADQYSDFGHLRQAVAGKRLRFMPAPYSKRNSYGDETSEKSKVCNIMVRLSEPMQVAAY